ncbi:hypothetical protein SDC9_169329 [bioreactor metagenome]|uniref:Uncharacterized protein n=1 Tax=bioreactor metagenome TaxID=1076179 RepID=A0A645G4W3_9ZZZZ
MVSALSSVSVTFSAFNEASVLGSARWICTVYVRVPASPAAALPSALYSSDITVKVTSSTLFALLGSCLKRSGKPSSHCLLVSNGPLVESSGEIVGPTALASFFCANTRNLLVENGTSILYSSTSGEKFGTRFPVNLASLS